MKLCGLDFETANSCNGSICSVGVAIVPEANSHRVNCMADMFGITFQHHDALEDAETCAKIASQLEIPKNFICRFEYLPNV